MSVGVRLCYSQVPEPDSVPGRAFKHEWVFGPWWLIQEPNIEKMKEIVVWCMNNWDDDPHIDYDWNYQLHAAYQHFYTPDKGWGASEHVPYWTLWIGTHDDAWAVQFNLAWAEHLGELKMSRS